MWSSHRRYNAAHAAADDNDIRLDQVDHIAEPNRSQVRRLAQNGRGDGSPARQASLTVLAVMRSGLFPQSNADSVCIHWKTRAPAHGVLSQFPMPCLQNSRVCRIRNLPVRAYRSSCGRLLAPCACGFDRCGAQRSAPCRCRCRMSRKTRYGSPTAAPQSASASPAALASFSTVTGNS